MPMFYCVYERAGSFPCKVLPDITSCVYVEQAKAKYQAIYVVYNNATAPGASSERVVNFSLPVISRKLDGEWWY